VRRANGVIVMKRSGFLVDHGMNRMARQRAGR
jgi:hypothetical protein